MIVKRRELFGQRYTKEDIYDVLTSNQSMEVDELHQKYVYYIHLDAEGNILDSKEGADECFTSGIGFEEYSDDADDEMDWYYAHENWDCKEFADVVEDLTDQVNDWLDELEAE